MSVDFRSQINQRFTAGSPQHRAATEALDKALQQTTQLDPGNVDAWLGYLKDHGGVVDSAAAARIFRAFMQLPPAQKEESAAPVLKASSQAALRRMGSTEKPWTERIDLRQTPAKVAGFEADLRFLNVLDLADPKQYQAFASWAGWTKPLAADAKTSYQDDFTIQHWLGGGLAQRHGLNGAQRREVLSIFMGPASERTRKLEAFIERAGPEVGATAKRSAVYDAFFKSMIHTRERILDGTTTEAKERGELEKQLGLKPGSIAARDFSDLLEMASPSWRHGETPAAYLEHAKRYESAQVFERAYVIEGRELPPQWNWKTEASAAERERF